jgi:tRNA pseudouridine38-40 synthase
MRRLVRLTLEYDGTDFAGFQLQAPGWRTVQGELESVIQKLSGQFSRVHGAGRTDAGVHALGQVAHFESDWGIPLPYMARTLNNVLPDDLVVKAVALAEPGFHSRFSATSRTYRYVILNREAPSALLGRFAHGLRSKLDLEAMREATQYLVGSHDFAAFGKASAPGHSTVRYMERFDIRSWKDCVLITVRGNAFLRQQVRSFVGTLLEVGRGKLSAQDVVVIRDSLDRGKCPPIAPAKGLCLVRVDYSGQRITNDGVISVID